MKKIKYTMKSKTLKSLKKDLEGVLSYAIGGFYTEPFMKLLQDRIEKKYQLKIDDLYRIYENKGCFIMIEKH